MAARKHRKGSRRRPNGAPESPYPSDTPLEESGLPKTDVNLSEETVGKIGFDPTSARKGKHFRDVLEKRAGGVKNVKWDADPRLKYAQMFAVHPNAKVSVKQVEPHVDESLDDQIVKVLPDYGALRKYIKDNHWKGDKATYQFEFYSASHPVIGEGLTYFDADPEWAERKEEEMARRQTQPQQNPQQNGGYGPPPQAGYPPPGYGGGYYPPPGHGYAYPPPGYAQPAPQTTFVMPQPLQQQAPPPQPPPPNAGNDVFLQYMIQQNEWLRQENSRLQSQPQQAPPPQAGAQDWLAWHNAERQRWEAEQAAKTAALVPAAPPKTAIDQMKETVEMIQSVTSMRDKIVGPVKEDPPETKAKDDDDGFPVLVKKVGPINIIADKKTGQIIRDPVMSAMFNAGNIEEAFDRVFKKAGEMMKERAEDSKTSMDKALELEKMKQANIKEKAQLVHDVADSEERIARARLMVGSMPTQQIPQAIPITQAQAEKIAEGPTVVAEVRSIPEQQAKPVYVPPPPPWRVNPEPETSPAERPASSSETRPEQVDTSGKIQPEHRNESPEDPEGNGSGPVVSAGEEETIPDTEPPPAPAPEQEQVQV